MSSPSTFASSTSTTRLGEQSYPVEQNGTLYVTTNDDSVWALNATTGAVKWRWSPSDQAVFTDFGVVTNRGVALCDGHVFELTLDMNIVSLNPATGALQKEVPISDAVPGATVGYGYSETSAPICADHTVIFGAAGSEYGVRGFVMAYHTNLTPAWPNPFWTVPPEGTEWRSLDRLAGGGVVWTPGTVDPDNRHALRRHRLRDAVLLPIGPARLGSPLRLTDRHRHRNRTLAVVAAAAGLQRVEVRHLAASARVHRHDRRQVPARGLGRHDGGPVVCVQR